MTDERLLAHAIGGPTDLPIPFLYALVGASWALTISFVVLALVWKEPRYAAAPEPAVRPRRPAPAVAGLVLAAWFGVALYAGPDEAPANGGLQAFYVLWWVGLVPLALVAGHVWRELSPWRTLTGRGRWEYPERLGYWPAAAGLFAFVWLELASPDPGDGGAVRIWVACYATAMLLGGVAFGPRWFDRADPFDVYSAFVARLSPFAGRAGPLRRLAGLPVAPGLVAVLAVLLGSTAFDSFSASPFWQAREPGGWLRTATLLGFCLAVGAAFVAAASATGGVSRSARRELPGAMASSLVPIVIGYVFAHYLTYLVEKGQQALYAVADPLGRGWFGRPETVYLLSDHPSVLAAIKVGCVVAGHVLAVIAAHDRALVLLPRSHRLTGQLAMLVLMVGYTFGGLYLLFSV